ncbi:MAG: thioredoxin family protein [Planctomycetota bacterium]
MSDSNHPHFDDKGAVHWHTDLAEALREATADEKLVFIEYGRAKCTNCRALVQNVVPMEDVAKLLGERYVCLAADCDEGDDQIDSLAMKLDGAEMLPFVIVTDARGQFLDGISGRVSHDALMRLLQRLSE